MLMLNAASPSTGTLRQGALLHSIRIYSKRIVATNIKTEAFLIHRILIKGKCRAYVPLIIQTLYTFSGFSGEMREFRKPLIETENSYYFES